MADIVTSQLLENSNSRWVMKLTSFSDGTGESAVAKVNATATGPLGVTIQGNTVYPGTHLVVTGIWYDIHGLGLRLLWEATANVDMLVLSDGHHDWPGRTNYGVFRGFVNPKTAGATGSILFTTSGQVAGSSYTVILEGLKGIQG